MLPLPKTICNEINEHFAIIGEKLGVQMTNTNNKTCINFLGEPQVSSVYLRSTDNQKIMKIIACFNIRKSPGYINISTTLIKKTKYFMSTKFS